MTTQTDPLKLPLAARTHHRSADGASSGETLNAIFDAKNHFIAHFDTPERASAVASACNREPEYRATLEAALEPLAVLVITDREKPYAEISPTLRRAIQQARDKVCAALLAGGGDK